MAKRSARRWRKLRLQILERDEYRCGYCGARANQVDHVTPINKGGNDDNSNLVAACATCNLRKGAGDAREFAIKRNLERQIKMESKNDFFDRLRTPPTPSLSVSPRDLRSPFIPPNLDRI